MKVLKIKALSGPNYWSITNGQLIVVTLDLKEFEYLPSNAIEGFNDSLKKLLPSLYDHFCSEGGKGGFFNRLDDGTWLGHVTEHVALELQWLAGMKCGFGKTRSTKEKGIYHVVFSYEILEAGLYAAEAAVNLVSHLAHQTPYHHLEKNLEALRRIQSEKGLGPSTLALVEEAQNRNIPYTRLDEGSLVMLGQGKHQRQFCSSMTSLTNVIAADIASDKNKTKQILSSAFILLPKGLVVETKCQLNDAVKEIGFPCVIKPAFGNHGRGITTNIQTMEKAVVAFELAQHTCPEVIVEQFISGSDYRFLLINYKVSAVAKRLPANVVGDGKSTIDQLIDQVNQDPQRGSNHDNILSKIIIDEVTLTILHDKGLTLNSILPAGKILYLKYAANLSTGGTAIDITETVHPNTLLMVERVARIMNLDICGIDVIAQDICKPLTIQNGAVIEVNACPGLRMHLSPKSGKARNVAKPIIEMLYPDNAPSRIPLISVTGTNGKTTTVKLIAHLAKNAGFSVGMTSTEGIYINHQQIFQGDCSGPVSAKAVLRDPCVDFAVLECARGGIIRSGLGFDQCNVSILLNITEDHLGQDGIETLEELARIKEVVPQSTMKEGYCILNADDDLVFKMQEELTCNIALFSTHSNNERIKHHCEQGGLAAYIEQGHIIVHMNGCHSIMGKLADIPISFSGKATCMFQNILAATLAGVACNFKLSDINQWLTTFFPTPEHIPGRMNLFQVKQLKILLDYAHNEAAFLHLREYFNAVAATKKIGIIAATGDRKVSDIRNIGCYAAQIFDEIIIRHDRDDRGCSNEEQTYWLIEGIKSTNTYVEKNIKIISEEKKALEYVIQHAPPGAIVMYFPENVSQATNYLKAFQQEPALDMVSIP